MHPILFELGPLTAYSYGTMLALAVAAGAFLAERRARKIGLPAGIIYDLSLWLMLSAIIGARSLYAALNIGEFAGDPLSIFALHRGGLVFYGGIAFAAAAGWIFSVRKRIAFGKLADLMAPSAALGIAIGRVGCFLNGCCYGKSAGYFVHPVQIYESLCALLIFFYLLWRQKNGSTSFTIKGNFLWFLLLYSFVRFFLEFARGDNQAVYLGMTLPQVFSIVIFAGTLLALLWQKKRERSK